MPIMHTVERLVCSGHMCRHVVAINYIEDDVDEQHYNFLVDEDSGFIIESKSMSDNPLCAECIRTDNVERYRHTTYQTNHLKALFRVGTKSHMNILFVVLNDVNGNPYIESSVLNGGFSPYPQYFPARPYDDESSVFSKSGSKAEFLGCSTYN